MKWAVQLEYHQMIDYHSKMVSDGKRREGARVISGFFTDEDSTPGRYDMNAEKYREKQIQLANRVEDLTKVALWGTMPKFAEYDYHLCRENDPMKFFGTGTVVPGIPMYWQEVDGIAELKYREVHSTRFKSTLLDADKMKEMKIHQDYMDTPAWIIWAFTDQDMYYKVNPKHKFRMALGRNTKVSRDLPEEYKPQIFIPMTYLRPVTSDMFDKE